jgi:anion-transporting  ArsA/GET3 family ATPase
MSDAVDEVLAGRAVCICVGSGGVGKTTTSAAVAAGMAARGLKVAVLTIDPAKRLADSLGLDELGNAARQVDPALFAEAGAEPGDGELWAMMLDAKATFDAVVARHAPDEAARERILGNRIYRQISGALAGSQEYMAMEKLYELHESGEYDLLVLDTPPSRNALDFLDAPRRLVQFIEGRSMRLFLRPTGIGARVAGRGASMVSSILRRLTGLDLLEDLSEFFAATGGMIGGFRERAERVNELLADERTTFLIVCGPAGEPIEEAVYLREKLADTGLPFGGIVVNRVHEGAAEGADAEEAVGAAVGDPGLATRVLAAASDRATLVRRDDANIKRLADRVGGCPLIRVPEQSDEVHDLAGLLGLGPWLFEEDGSAG